MFHLRWMLTRSFAAEKRASRLSAASTFAFACGRSMHFDVLGVSSHLPSSYALLLRLDVRIYGLLEEHLLHVLLGGAVRVLTSESP
jgi:hypothetical protein